MAQSSDSDEHVVSILLQTAKLEQMANGVDPGRQQTHKRETT